jgi:acyl carrier protein
MSDQEIRNAVFAALRRVAPEVDPATLRPNVSVREQADIDSVDYLNFIIELHERLGVEIPEADYGRMSTLDDCVRYLATRLGAAAGT